MKRPSKRRHNDYYTPERREKLKRLPVAPLLIEREKPVSGWAKLDRQLSAIEAGIARLEALYLRNGWL